jgi:hypothetical protein
LFAAGFEVVVGDGVADGEFGMNSANGQVECCDGAKRANNATTVTTKTQAPTKSIGRFQRL